MVEIFLFKSRVFIQVKNSFFKVRVSIQVEIFFIEFKMFQFKSRFKFISSREIFLTSRFLSQVENFFHVGIFIQVENFFSCCEFFHAKIFPFKGRFLFFLVKICFHVDMFQFKVRVEMFHWIIVGISRLR